MHQSFVTMAPVGPGNSRDFKQNPDKFTALQGHFVVKTMPKTLLLSWQVNVKLQPQASAWNQKPHRVRALWGQCRDQNMALNSRYVTAIPGPMGAEVRNDTQHKKQNNNTKFVCMHGDH